MTFVYTSQLSERVDDLESLVEEMKTWIISTKSIVYRLRRKVKQIQNKNTKWEDEIQSLKVQSACCIPEK